ncbi:MAG: hypothetical protein ABW170_01630 [Candidatus Thiodiazotropha sp. L084R]
MPYIAPYRSQLRPYNHAYAYRGLTAFATLSMAVSEGVETEAQRNFLESHECDEIQGTLFSPPVTADEVIVLLKKVNSG